MVKEGVGGINGNWKNNNKIKNKGLGDVCAENAAIWIQNLTLSFS